MLKECDAPGFRIELFLVLILILMEHAQREQHDAYQKTVHGVLILILMEHAQREEWKNCK